MEKNIDVRFSREAAEFVNGLSIGAARKLENAVNRTRSGLQGQWFKKLTGTAGIWEFRVKADNTFIRLFAFWDTTGETETLIIATHGIYKKTNRTPRKEIAKAESMKNKYFAQS